MNREQSTNMNLIDTLIGAAVSAVGGVPGHILVLAQADHDPKMPRGTASFASINTLLAKMGTDRENIEAFVMPAVVFADLVGDSIANYQFDRVDGATIYQDVVQAFGRDVIVADSQALVLPATTDGGLTRYGVLGLGGTSLRSMASADFFDSRNTKIILGIFHSSVG